MKSFGENVPEELFNQSIIPSLNVPGRGGNERDLVSILHNAARVSSSLYDCKVEYFGREYLFEIKKQENIQWFDIGKYGYLDDIENNLWMLFVIHKKGIINLITVIKLSNFIELCYCVPETVALGWNKDVVNIAYDLKQKYPQLQFKVKADIRKLVRNYSNQFQIIYENYIL